MRLHRFQQQLQRLYELEVAYNVDDFLITDAALARNVARQACQHTASEQLLVRQDGEDMDLSLYLDQALLELLGKDDPMVCLHDGNLEGFLTALEGVSHFLYLVWSAAYRRHVTPFELELQAEVDKYFSAAFLLGAQRRGRVPPNLYRRLFHGADLDPGLRGEERERYRHAHRYAARYCARLQERFLRGDGRAGLVTELRRFYRMSRNKKLGYIRSFSA